MKRILAAVVLSGLFGCSSGASAPPPSANAQGAPQGEARYVCPMECRRPGDSEPYSQAEPGRCPVCGMELHRASAAR